MKFNKIILLLLFLYLPGCSPAFHKSSPLSPQDTGTSSNGSTSDNDALNESTGLSDWDETRMPASKRLDGKNGGTIVSDSDLHVDEPINKQSQAALDESLDLCNVSNEFWQKGDFDTAFQTLDQAYSLLLTVDETNTVELIQQKEDLRFLISKRILEIYASRNRVVNGDHNAIPLTINKEVQREIDLFTQGIEKEFFQSAYRRSGKYRPFIVKKLEAAGLPVELSWLPLIESGFKPRALSTARALGLWQFIPSTGYKFGLERNVYVDERLDPEKSTEAAIKYLSELHQIFGDWSTVLAAYNSGEGRVLRLIRTQGINYLDNFWDLYEQLPRETSRYVPRFLATLHIIANPDKYGLTGIAVDSPTTYETVSVSRQAHLKEVAAAISVSKELLVELNPALRHQILPDSSYPLKIPVGTRDVLIAAIDTIPVASPARAEKAVVYHRVRPGESLSTIAKRYHTSVAAIARTNNIHQLNKIKTGQLLKIASSRNWSASPQSAPVRTSGKTTRHVVKRGDSLWNIAQRYNTTVKMIQSLNNLSSTTLTIGQTLGIPGGGDNKADKASKTYLVKSGDSPFMIAQNHSMPLQQFLELNSLTQYSKIFPGQSVYVK